MLSRAPTGRIDPLITKKTPTEPNYEASTKISSQKRVKVVGPLGNKKHKTPFSAMYSKGGLPCRLQHGSIKHKLVWTTPPQLLDYDPIFITFLLGLCEDCHPFQSIVQNGLEYLIDAEGAKEKITQILPKIVSPIRVALSLKDKELFLVALGVFKKLILSLEEAIVPLLSSILPPIASRIMSKESQIRDAIHELLTQIQISCGEAGLKVVRQKVPTYSQMF